MSTAPVITIFVRHADGCKESGNEFSKRCSCRKHLRWTLNGKQYRKQAGTRSWAEAESVKRNMEDQLSGRAPSATVDAKTTNEALALFLQAKELEGITAPRMATYRTQLHRFVDYAAAKGIIMLSGLTPDLSVDYCATMRVSNSTKHLYLKMLSTFLGYCYDAKWLDRRPKMPRVALDTVETEPLTSDEYTRLLAVVTVPKVRALIQLMRHSGLAVRDAATLERSEVTDCGAFYRVTTDRQKTGTHVSVPIPRAVGDEILAVAGEQYIFDHSGNNDRSFAKYYGTRIAIAFESAGLNDGGFMKSHRLRDTFAVELLSKGVPMEEVSKLLGHGSIRTTEMHYARWVKGRQDRLDSLVIGTWAAPVTGRKSRAT
ncbi:MAG: tyrosine-type recombinase/integrase [Terracidiphilus sp.]